MILPYLLDNQVNSQYEYDHQVYPLIQARSPEQMMMVRKCERKDRVLPMASREKVCVCVCVELDMITLTHASHSIRAAVTPDIPPSITITEGIETCCLGMWEAN